MNKKTLKQLTEIAVKIAKRQLLLKEAAAPTPSQSDLDNMELLADDVKKVKAILASMYKDVMADIKANENPSVYMDAYMKLILAMFPITAAMMDAGILAGALKQGKLALGSGAELKLGNTAPTKSSPPIQSLPPKVSLPPKGKLPPVPPKPGKQSIPPPPPPPPNR